MHLEPYDDVHLDGLCAMNSEPDVMRYILGRPQTRAETEVGVLRAKARWASFGYSWWSFIETASGELVGAGCLQNLRREAVPDPDPMCPMEIGWRLRRDRWHLGLATEAANAMANYAFGNLMIDPLLAVCEPENRASRAVMMKLGMRYRGLEPWYGHDLATYELSSEQWSITSRWAGKRSDQDSSKLPS